MTSNGFVVKQVRGTVMTSPSHLDPLSKTLELALNELNGRGYVIVNIIEITRSPSDQSGLHTLQIIAYKESEVVT
jgi:hypothetical protein